MRVQALNGNLHHWCSLSSAPCVPWGESVTWGVTSLGDCWKVQKVSACTSPGDDYVTVSLSCPEMERLVCCLGH